MSKEFSQDPQDLPRQALYPNYVHPNDYIPHVIAESREPAGHKAAQVASFVVAVGIGFGLGAMARQVIEELPADAHGSAVCASKDFVLDISATDPVGKPLPVHWQGHSADELYVGDYDVSLANNDFYSLTVTCGVPAEHEGIIEEHEFIPAEARNTTVFCQGPEGPVGNPPHSLDGCQATYY